MVLTVTKAACRQPAGDREFSSGLECGRQACCKAVHVGNTGRARSSQATHQIGGVSVGNQESKEAKGEHRYAGAVGGDGKGVKQHESDGAAPGRLRQRRPHIVPAPDRDRQGWLALPVWSECDCSRHVKRREAQPRAQQGRSEMCHGSGSGAAAATRLWMLRRRDQNSIRNMMGGTTSRVRNRASHRLQAKGLVKPHPVGVAFPACREEGRGRGGGLQGSSGVLLLWQPRAFQEQLHTPGPGSGQCCCCCLACTSTPRLLL